MLVTARMNRMGHVEVKPVNKRYKGESLYLQFESDIESFLADVPKRIRKDLDNGWDIRFRLDVDYSYFQGDSDDFTI